MSNETKMSANLVVSLIIAFLHFCSASDPDPLQDFCVTSQLYHPRHSPPPCKNSSEVSADDFVFSGAKKARNFSGYGVASISVNPAVFPGLNTLGMSFVRADLIVGAVNPPHFHPRATEIMIVMNGRIYAGFVDSENRVFAKVVEEGDVMVFPRGLLHFQMNVGKKTARIFGTFNSQNPGVQKIPSAIFGSGINEEVLEKGFGLSPQEIRKMRRKFEHGAEN